MTSHSQSSSQNFASGTVWTGDCLEIMRGMNSETVNLIYLGPTVQLERQLRRADRLGRRWCRVQRHLVALRRRRRVDQPDRTEAPHRAPRAIGSVNRLGQELLGLHGGAAAGDAPPAQADRLDLPALRPDNEHYLKLLMDAVFGRRNFKNEISWKRTSSRSDARRYGRIHDTLLYYVLGSEGTWNGAWEPHDEEYVNRFYRHSDEAGRRYMLDNMTSPNPRPNMTYTWRGFPPPEKGWRYERETMQRLHDEGRIWYPASTDRQPRLKR